MAAHVEGKEYDVIFAGGGTAGCIAAGRLAKADPSLSILIIERGKSSFQNPLVSNLGLVMTNLVPQTGHMAIQMSNPHDAVNGRPLFFAGASILGGGSSINLSMYTRASASDFDAWKTEGWDAKSLIPLARRCETFRPNGSGYNMDVHGDHGPIQVSHGPYSAKKEHQDDLLAAYETQGLKEVPDNQDFEACHAASRLPRYVGPDGKRSDVASAYLLPLIQSGTHPNLHILTETTVRRVLFTGTHASGVECEPTIPLGATAPADHPVQTIRAKKWVVVSAGTLCTSSILERSGVGCADRLRKLDIPVVSDVPGVGEGYDDHHTVMYHFTARLQRDESLDALHPQFGSPLDAARSGSPMLSWNGIDVIAKLRLTDAEIDSLGPAFREAWDRDFKNEPTKPLAIIGCLLGWLGFEPTPANETTQVITVAPYTLYPYSRGDMHIVSKDPHVPPTFNHGFLTDDLDLDLKVQVLYYKKVREIARRTNLVIAEHKPSHPSFHPDSPAYRLHPDQDPAAAVAGAEPRFRSYEERASLPPIQYSAEDDAAIEAHVRQKVAGMYHSMGLAKMAPLEKRGVVDSRLNVYGTTGLKLADLSICPSNVCANTANTAIIVGEKAADLLAAEFGLVIA